jgi:hypothetical protein
VIDGKKMKSRLQTLLIIKERNKRRSQPKIKKHQSLKNLSLMSIMIVLILVTFIPILGGFFFTQLTEDLPTVDWIPAYLDPENGILLNPTTLLDESGENEIYRLQEPGNQRRFLSIDPNQPEFISPYVVQLAVATYQPDFWSSPGYNINFLSEKPGNAYQQAGECQKLAETDNELARMYFVKAIALEALENDVAKLDWERMLELDPEAILPEWKATALAYLETYFTPTPTSSPTLTATKTIAPKTTATQTPTPKITFTITAPDD